MGNLKYYNDIRCKLNELLEKDETILKKELSSFYYVEAEKLNKEIGYYYAKYGKNNIIEYYILLQKLSSEEIWMLIKDIDEFVNKYPEYIHLLPTKKLIYKFDRIKVLQTYLNLRQIETGVKEEEIIRSHLSKHAEQIYEYTYESLGHGKTSGSYNKSVFNTVLNNKWCGEQNFSSRIWKNRSNLSKHLQSEMVAGIIRGLDYKTITSYLNKIMISMSKKMFTELYTLKVHM